MFNDENIGNFDEWIQFRFSIFDRCAGKMLFIVVILIFDRCVGQILFIVVIFINIFLGKRLFYNCKNYHKEI